MTTTPAAGVGERPHHNCAEECKFVPLSTAFALGGRGLISARAQQGYGLLAGSRPEEALLLFKFNAERRPRSWVVHDSLGDGYLAVGDRRNAARAYLRSLQLNAENRHALREIKKLGVRPPPETNFPGCS